jgi:hypothetical protein
MDKAIISTRKISSSSYEKGWKDGRKELIEEIEKKLQLWKLSGEDDIYCVHKADWFKFVKNLKSKVEQEC